MYLLLPLLRVHCLSRSLQTRLLRLPIFILIGLTVSVSRLLMLILVWPPSCLLAARIVFLPSRHLSYAVHGDHAGAKAVPVNESLLAHFERPLRPNLLVGLSVRDAMALESSFRGIV